MANHSSNIPRGSDSENTPPKLTNSKSKVRGGIQGSSRRRRVRSSGGSNHSRYAVAHAKHKNALKRQSSPINVLLPSSDAQASDATTAPAVVSLPRYLCRPPFRQISKATIMAVAPELADTALDYIRDGLECLGPRMLQVLAAIKAAPAPTVLSTELQVCVNDISSDMPTHMLAVYTRHTPPASKRRVTLFPMHSIILATHCSNLPNLPPSNVVRPDTVGSIVSVPVVPLCIPAPDVFPQLSTFLYTKRVDCLLASLLPCPVPPPLYRGNPKSERIRALFQQFSNELATSHSVQTLLSHAMAVNGLWRNTCALGIDDGKLWCALDVAWEILITALGVATGERL